MRFVYFTHSLTSCWNHGNAHFVRGVLRALRRAGHEVAAFEPADGWSRTNLVSDHGRAAVDAFTDHFPDLSTTTYGADLDPEAAVDGADVVIVHEWTDPALVAAVGRLRARGAPFTLLFHDTHHRVVSDPDAMGALDLDGYDHVLAFGAALAEIYRRRGWGRRAHVWHEAADLELFRPPSEEGERSGAVWIGNWGDGERGPELEDYLLRPARGAGLDLTVHGVRYPEAARAALARHGAAYRGWLPNVRVPEVFARHALTVHVPRRFYVDRLPGIPTIRVFEALACGIPLLCAPWRDEEGLFRVGEDFLVAEDGAAMRRLMAEVSRDPARATAMARSGLETVRARHGCVHRAAELLDIVGAQGRREAA